MFDNGPALVVLLPVAAYGVLRTIRDFRSASAHWRDRSRIHRVARVRLAAWLSSWLCAGLMVGDLLLRGPRWIALAGFAGIFAGWLAYLALSLLWGALGGPED